MLDLKPQVEAFKFRLDFKSPENIRLRDQAINLMLDGLLLSQNASQWQTASETYSPKSAGTKVNDAHDHFRLLNDCEKIFKAQGENAACQLLKDYLKKSDSDSSNLKLVLFVIGFLVFSFFLYQILLHSKHQKST